MNNGREIKVSTMLDNLCTNTDFDLLYAQKLCLEAALNDGTRIPKPALEGLINLLDQLGDLGETLGRFRYDGIEPPFPMQPDYQKKVVVFEPEPEPNVHVLCEEYEGKDGIREFRTLATSRSREDLQALMRAKIEKDEYGFIAENGVCGEGDNFFQTNFEDGFVEYYILEEEVLSKDRIQELLNSDDFRTRFSYPEGFKEFLAGQIKEIADNRGYGAGLDHNIAAQHFMDDKLFQARLKIAWWFSSECLTTSQRAVDFCTSFVCEKLGENPALFEEIGAVPPYRGPHNIREAVMDNVYDVAKRLRLSSLDADYVTNKLLRSVPFRTWVTEEFGDLEHLDFESPRYRSDFVHVCQGFLEKMDELHVARRPELDQIIAGASARTSAASYVPAAERLHSSEPSPER